MLVEARIPEGCLPGDAFIVEACGQEFEVTVPGGARRALQTHHHVGRAVVHRAHTMRTGCGAHDVISIELDLPGEPEPAIGAPAPNPSGAATSAFEVVIPDDCVGPGSLFVVEAAGRVFEVEVPDG